MSEPLKELDDAEKAILYVYLHSKGLPPWGIGADDWKPLAMLCGWDEARTRAALELAVQQDALGKRGIDDHL